MKSKSFTLIELLVVVAVIGLLASIAIYALNNARKNGRDAKRIADLKSFSQAMELYYLDNNHYPIWDTGGCINDPNNPLSSILVPDYLGSLPKDPFNNLYCYYYKTQNSGKIYKIAAFMEKMKEKALNDGGTADSYYERFSLEEGTQISLTDSDLSGPQTAWKLYKDSSIVAFWKMDETSWNGTPNEVTDSSGYENDGTAKNDLTTTETDCISGRCGDFDGEDDYIEVPDFTGTFTELTVETWIFPKEYNNYKKIVDFGISDTGRRFTLQLEADGIDFELDGGISGWVEWFSTPANQWLHVVGVWRGKDFIRLYVKGELKAENTEAPTISTLTIQSSDAHIIGRRITAKNFFNGKIDEVRIYNRALTACEICERCLEYKDSDFCNNCTPCE